MTPTPTLPTDGTVIVRLRAEDQGWIHQLPVVRGRSLTVTVGRADLLPVPAEELLARGYRLVGVAAEHRPIGPAVDVMVPASLREEQPGWWAQLEPLAERVFDLRMGPVRQVLAAEIDVHLRHAQP